MNGEKEARRGPIDGREGGIDLCRCSNLDGNGAAAAGAVGPVEAAARRRKAVRKGGAGDGCEAGASASAEVAAQRVEKRASEGGRRRLLGATPRNAGTGRDQI